MGKRRTGNAGKGEYRGCEILKSVRRNYKSKLITRFLNNCINSKQNKTNFRGQTKFITRVQLFTISIPVSAS